MKQFILNHPYWTAAIVLFLIVCIVGWIILADALRTIYLDEKDTDSRNEPDTTRMYDGEY